MFALPQKKSTPIPIFKLASGLHKRVTPLLRCNKYVATILHTS